jgi:predicted DNA binding CopG/RHH family protein
MNKRKNIPKFRSEAEERSFWSKNDSTDYLDWTKAKRVHFPNLKATSRTISIRLPESLIEEIKVLANKQDVPYQSMLKILLADKVRERTVLHRGKGKAA